MSEIIFKKFKKKLAQFKNSLYLCSEKRIEVAFSLHKAKINKIMNVGRNRLLSLGLFQSIEVPIGDSHSWERIRSNVRYTNTVYGKKLGWRIRTRINSTKTKIQITKEKL